MSSELMNIEEILAHLPHRYPFLLIDRVLHIEPGKSLRALKNVSINEPFFSGHFPVKAVMPGVLILEALAQAGAILLSRTVAWDPNHSLFYLGSIENARFKKMVVPGDQLYLDIEFQRQRAKVYKFKGIATVHDEVVCSVEMTSVEGSIHS